MSASSRYPGLLSFTESEKDRYFGREHEIAELIRQINQEKLTVLYGKSGLGKSSILAARIAPILAGDWPHKDAYAKKNSRIVIPVRFHAYTADRHIYPLGILDRILTDYDHQPTYLNDVEPGDPTFWEHCKNILLLNPGKTGIVFIFDQFEEIFSYPPEGVEAFAQILADLLGNRMPYSFQQCLIRQLRNQPSSLTDDQLQFIDREEDIRAVIAIRADRLSELNRLASSIPDIQRSFYELQPMMESQAIEAIVKPAALTHEQFASPPFQYDNQALRAMIQALTTSDHDELNTSSRIEVRQHTQVIETFQIQLICQYIENEIVVKQQKTLIEPADLINLRSLFKQYYDDRIAEIRDPGQRRAVQVLIEDGMILKDYKRRLSLLDKQIFATYQIQEPLLASLVDKRLLRSEPDGRGGFLYEIIHDTMVDPILHARDIREAREVIERENALKTETSRRRLRAALLTAAVLAAVLLIGGGLASRYVSELRKLNTRLTDMYTDQYYNTIFSDFNRSTTIAQNQYNLGTPTSTSLVANTLLILTEASLFDSSLSVLTHIGIPYKATQGTDSLAFIRKHISTLIAQKQLDSIRDALYPDPIALPGGSFTMGAVADDRVADPDEFPRHEVQIKPFSLSRTEVTVAQYHLFCIATGHKMPMEPNFGWKADHPIVNVNQAEAQAYCDWLSAKSGKVYRLPTEAEWEYAAREGGRPYLYPWGDSGYTGNMLDLSYSRGTTLPLADPELRTYDDGYIFTAPAGSYRSNAWQLHDLAGNAQEWVADLYHPDYYMKIPAVYPNRTEIFTHPDSGDTLAVVRGGGWNSGLARIRISNRSSVPIKIISSTIGFRVAMNAP